MATIQSAGQILSVVYAQGHIMKLTDNSFYIADKEKNSFATVNFKDCTFNYAHASDVLGDNSRDYDDECVTVSLDKDGHHSFVAILSMKA